jgi:hypothetical protein
MKKLLIVGTICAASLLAAVPAVASAATVKVPTEDSGQQARPFVIDFTGDGSGYLGGFGGHAFTKAHPAFGRLRWTEYNASQGRAWGAMWADQCTPDCASGTFTSSKVYVHVYRPRNGVFTRMTLSGDAVGHRSETLRAEQSGGYWEWF